MGQGVDEASVDPRGLNRTLGHTTVDREGVGKTEGVPHAAGQVTVHDLKLTPQLALDPLLMNTDISLLPPDCVICLLDVNEHGVGGRLALAA